MIKQKIGLKIGRIMLLEKCSFLIVTLLAVSIKEIASKASLLIFLSFVKYDIFRLADVEKQMLYCTHISMIVFLLLAFFSGFLIYYLMLRCLFPKWVIFFWIFLILLVMFVAIKHYLLLQSFDYSNYEFLIIRSNLCY